MLGHRGVIGGNGTGFAECAQVFGGIETERIDCANGSRFSVVPGSTGSLGRVLNHLQFEFVCDLVQTVHIDALPIKVNGHNRVTPGRRRFQVGFQPIDIKVQGFRIDVGEERTCAGANYGLYPSPEGHLKAVGQWNKTRIVAKGAHVEHWLNDFKVVEYELWSADWEAKVAATKFNAWPKFGRAKRGHIGIQGDHAGMLAFRNIRIRELR